MAQRDLHLARKVWHMSMGLIMAGIYASGLSKWTSVYLLLGVLAFNLMTEFARLRNPTLNKRILKMLGPLMRSNEVDKVSGVPFYLCAAILTIAIFPKQIAVLSILFLACGDPIASAFGIRFGHLSYRFSSGKSLIGTLAGVVACGAISWFYFEPYGYSMRALWTLTLVGALAGGAAETLPIEVDDNFSIPIVSGFALWVTFIVLGL